MNKYRLPKSTTIAGVECEFVSDYRDILEILEILQDPDLLESESIFIALSYFYKTEDYFNDVSQAIDDMFDFLSCCKRNDNKKEESDKKPLYDWEKDFNIIVAPVNKIVGYDIRGVEYLHWWTFMSAFMEIGECTFSTYVSIREKLNKGIKLEKNEEKIFREHRDAIVIKRKYDSATQELMDLIMGREA